MSSCNNPKKRHGHVLIDGRTLRYSVCPSCLDVTISQMDKQGRSQCVVLQIHELASLTADALGVGHELLEASYD